MLALSQDLKLLDFLTYVILVFEFVMIDLGVIKISAL